MRVVFMGTPDIAAVCLRRLIDDKFDILRVYTKTDKPVGRGNQVRFSPVKELALANGIPVSQPDTFRDPEIIEELRALRPDVIAVVAYGKLLPETVLNIPTIGCINIHGSILPALRGPGPVQWSVLNHLERTGVTAMYMSAALDSGDIIDIRETEIGFEETSGELMERISVLAADLLADVLHRAETEPLPRTPQNEALATYAPLLTKALSPIDFTRTFLEIHDLVRGLQPWPVATMQLCGKDFKVFRVVKVSDDRTAPAGTILGVTKKGLEIACADSVLCVTELQAQGGKRMPAADYFRGHPIKIPE